jgi:two-component system CheB/CheR fusion protein
MPYIRQHRSQHDGAIITFNDITKLKKAQEEVDTSNQNLRRINADLDSFVYAASHDLLGPLSTIEGLIYLLRNHADESEEKRIEYNSMLDASIHKFKAAIKGLTSIGRIESEMHGEQASISFKELLDDIKLSILDKITVTEAIIIENLEVKVIKFSKKNLRSILYNLISNALKFIPSGRSPEILISTKAIEGFVQLTVSDNGIGMAEDKITSVFTLYRRLNTHMEGQGIGLYLVKKIIDATGGKIEITSEEGKGTTFVIYMKV